MEWEEENAKFKKLTEELEQRFGMNLENSSKPPCSEPPAVEPTRYSLLRVLTLLAFIVTILLLASTLSYRVYRIWFRGGCCVCGNTNGTSEHRYGAEGHHIRIYCSAHQAPSSISEYPGEPEDFLNLVAFPSPLLAVIAMYIVIKSVRVKSELAGWLGGLIGMNMSLLLILYFRVYISLGSIVLIALLAGFGVGIIFWFLCESLQK